jgi:hypothetical protein
VRDMQHLKDMARPAQSAGGQSGSARQVNQFRARGVLDEYVSAISETPLAPTSPTNPDFQIDGHASAGQVRESLS